MKTLCLLRHAKSSRKDLSLADVDRPLSDRGKKETVIIGKILKQQDFCPDSILCSSSRRTRSTLKRICKITKRKKKNIIYTDSLYEILHSKFLGFLNPKISLQSFLSLIQELDDKLDTVMIVGHNPGCIELAQYFGCRIETIKPCGLVTIQFDTNSRKSCAKSSLLSYNYLDPKIVLDRLET